MLANKDLCHAQLIAKRIPFIPRLDFWPERFGATFYAQKRCLSKFFDIQTGLDLTNGHKMPDLVPM